MPCLTVSRGHCSCLQHLIAGERAFLRVSGTQSDVIIDTPVECQSSVLGQLFGRQCMCDSRDCDRIGLHGLRAQMQPHAPISVMRKSVQTLLLKYTTWMKYQRGTRHSSVLRGLFLLLDSAEVMTNTDPPPTRPHSALYYPIRLSNVQRKFHSPSGSSISAFSESAVLS